jgi:hypothetical protein
MTLTGYEPKGTSLISSRFSTFSTISIVFYHLFNPLQWCLKQKLRNQRLVLRPLVKVDVSFLSSGQGGTGSSGQGGSSFLSSGQGGTLSSSQGGTTVPITTTPMGTGTSLAGQLFTPGQQPLFNTTSILAVRPLFNTTSILAVRSFSAHDPLGLRSQGNLPISGAQAPNVVALQGQDISVHRLTLKVAAKRTILVVDICLFKKQDWQKLDPEKKQALFDQFLKKQCPKFKPMSMQLEQDKAFSRAKRLLPTSSRPYAKYMPNTIG